MGNFIEYTIQPTDSVAGIAKRFRVNLHELVKLNPQVCTPLPQMGIVLKIPVDHLEVLPVPDVLPGLKKYDDVDAIEAQEKERFARFVLKLPNGELYRFDKIISMG